MNITLDGVTYDLPVIDTKVTLNTLDAYAERTLDGVLHRQVIGTYQNYSLTFGAPLTSKLTDYINFWLAISAAVPSHTATMPDGYASTFYIGDGAARELRKIYKSAKYWKNMTVQFIEMAPSNL